MRRVLLSMLLALIVISGCGGPAIDPQALVTQSADAFDKVDTFHFRLLVSDGKPAPIESVQNLIITSAEGDLQRPNKISAALKAQSEGVPIALNIKVIILESEAFLSNPLNPNQWESLGDASGSLAAFAPAKGVTDALRGLKNLEAKGEETIDGVNTQHIAGSADASVLQALTGGEAPAGTVQIEVWIGAEDKLPRQIVAIGRLDPKEPEQIKRTIYLSEYGKSVTIEAPK